MDRTKIIKLSILSLSVILAGFLFVLSVKAEERDVKLLVEPQVKEAKKGQLVEVILTVDSKGTEFNALTVNLEYTEDAVNLDLIDSSRSGLKGEIESLDNKNGEISISRYVPEGKTTKGSVEIARIKFRAIADGKVYFKIKNSSIVANEGRNILDDIPINLKRDDSKGIPYNEEPILKKKANLSFLYVVAVVRYCLFL